jgi:carbon storage regulator
MLVLSRRAQETIVINGNIRITVVWIGHDRVRLGIEAPRDVTVHRQEVAARIAACVGEGVEQPALVTA